MRWPEAGQKLFPSPHRAEPENLRQDIIDELADHLALAADDEAVKQGQSREAVWRRVIERFGNPNGVARRLWWDAMKERVMRDWIHTGIAAVSAIVVVLVAVLVINGMNQMQTTQVQLLDVLKQMNRPSAAAGETLEVIVRRGSKDGPPAEGVEVRFAGKISGEDTASVSLTTDKQGRARFEPVPQGAYQIRLIDPHSMMETDVEHSIFAGVGNSLTIVAPDISAQEKEVKLERPLPFPNNRVMAYATLRAEEVVDGQKWGFEEKLLVGDEEVYESVSLHAGSRTCFKFEFHKGEDSKVLLPMAQLRVMEVVVALLMPNEMLALEPNGLPPTAELKSFPPDAQTLTVDLTDNQRQLAEQKVKEYLLQTRWLQQDLWSVFGRNVRTSSDPFFSGYIVSGIPITDGQTVSMTESGDGKVLLTTKGIEHREDDYVVVGSEDHPAALKLPDLAALNKQFPGDYRFLISFCCVRGEDVFFWRADGWPSGEGETFEAMLEPVQPPDEPNERYDITAFVRAHAGAQAAGILVKAGEEIILASEKPRDGNRVLPYVLVVSDTPPADL